MCKQTVYSVGNLLLNRLVTPGVTTYSTTPIIPSTPTIPSTTPTTVNNTTTTTPAATGTKLTNTTNTNSQTQVNNFGGFVQVQNRKR